MYKQNVTTKLGYLEVHITFTNCHNNVMEVKKTYSSMDDADRYIELHMRNYMCDKLKRYIFHKINIFETASQGWSNTINKCEALDHCRLFIPQLRDANLFTIGNWILASEIELTRILPSPRNPSYTSSSHNLQELVWMSVQLRKYQRRYKVTA